MNRFLKFLFLFYGFSAVAQIHEIGVFAGGSNYVGDVGATNYIAPNNLAAGILYKWNRNPRLTYRFSYSNSRISANDGDADEPSRMFRKYEFKNSINEFAAGLEFNFFEFNLHESGRKITPYVHSGIIYSRFKEAYLDTNIVVINQQKGTIAIPMTVGIKSNILRHFVLGFEVGARYTFTDNFDGSNPEDQTKIKFGNINNNDWYVFSGVTFTYTFGDKPCYCAE